VIFIWYVLFFLTIIMTKNQAYSYWFSIAAAITAMLSQHHRSSNIREMA
jgi:hypothetical protein